MRFATISPAILAFLLALATASMARAGASLTDFNAAVEDAASHNRVALGYLRTGNTDLAALEVERLRAAWSTLVATFGGNRPDAFEQTLYTTTLADVSAKLVAADMLLKSGRPEAMEASLAGVRDALSNLRRKSGIAVLADCVLDAGTAMKALGDLDKTPLDWAAPGAAARMSERTGKYRQELQRCDAMAAAPVKDSPEFRRLVDGALGSLALIPKAIETRDGDLFHRIVIELRSFDNLLAFRFG